VRRCGISPRASAAHRVCTPSRAKRTTTRNHRRSGPSFIPPISAINSPPTSSITPSTRSARSRGRSCRHLRPHARHPRRLASDCTESTTRIVPRGILAEGSAHERFLHDSPQFHLQSRCLAIPTTHPRRTPTPLHPHDCGAERELSVHSARTSRAQLAAAGGVSAFGSLSPSR